MDIKMFTYKKLVARMVPCNIMWQMILIHQQFRSYLQKWELLVEESWLVTESYFNSCFKWVNTSLFHPRFPQSGIKSNSLLWYTGKSPSNINVKKLKFHLSFIFTQSNDWLTLIHTVHFSVFRCLVKIKVPIKDCKNISLLLNLSSWERLDVKHHLSSLLWVWPH